MGAREQLEQVFTLELGRHIIADIIVEDGSVLKDVNYLRNLLYNAAKLANLNVISDNYTIFENTGGVSLLLFISESHVSIHTWPEYSFAAVDIFTCGKDADPWKAYDYIIRELKARVVNKKEIKRVLSLKK